MFGLPPPPPTKNSWIRPWWKSLLEMTEACKVPLFIYDTFTASFVTSTASGCGLIRTSNTRGILQTGDGAYSKNLDCRWTLTSNAMVELVFVDLNIEKSYDYIAVYDGDSTAAPLIGRFSGRSLPAPITSSSNKLFVRFTTDGSVQDQGFTILYRGTLHLKPS